MPNNTEATEYERWADAVSEMHGKRYAASYDDWLESLWSFNYDVETAAQALRNRVELELAYALCAYDNVTHAALTTEPCRCCGYDPTVTFWFPAELHRARYTESVKQLLDLKRVR